MFSFKNPLFAWATVIIIIIIIIIWPPFPIDWPPPCLVCGSFVKDFMVPLIFGVLGMIGVIQNLRSNNNLHR